MGQALQDAEVPAEAEAGSVGSGRSSSVSRGIAPERDQPGVLGMQLQPELHEPLARVVEELRCITKVLEPRQ
jgi:hypothetical protein